MLLMMTTLTRLSLVLRLWLSLSWSSAVLAIPHLSSKRATNTKLGLPWTDGSVPVTQFTSRMSWYYNWGAGPGYPNSHFDGVEFVPMFWGNRSISSYGVLSDVVSSDASPSVLGFNEPQTIGQSELTPAQAAELWMQYLEPLKRSNPHLRLGSPSPSAGPTAKLWLAQFFGNCTSCTVDFLALHWYYIYSQDFIDYMTDMHYSFNRTIWVTEWACINFADSSAPCNGSAISQLMNETQSWMDGTDFIERYAWFGAFREMPQGLDPGLRVYDENGKITALGKQYIGWTNTSDPPRYSGSSPAAPSHGTARSTAGWIIPAVLLIAALAVTGIL